MLHCVRARIDEEYATSAKNNDQESYLLLAGSYRQLLLGEHGELSDMLVHL